MRVEISNQSHEEQLKNDRGSPLGFVVIGPEHLKFKHETQTTTKKKKKKTNSLSLNPFWFKKEKKSQFRGSLNRYGFAYARRHKVNQAAKVAPGVIKAATNDINNVSEKVQIKLEATDENKVSVFHQNSYVELLKTFIKHHSHF